MRHIKKVGLFFVGLTAVILMGLSVFFVTTYAIGAISWTSDSDPSFISGHRLSDSDPNFSLYGCRSQQVIIDGQSAPKAACITVGKTIKLGVYNDNGYRLGVSFPGDSKLYPITNVSHHDYYRNPILIPGTDILYNRQSINSAARSLLVYQNFPAKLSKTTDVFGYTGYTWNYDDADFTLKDETGDALGVNGAGHSTDGRWIVAEIMGRGIVRVDTQQLTAKVVSRHYNQYGVGRNPSMEFAISSDGQHVGMGGQNAGIWLFDTPDSCGDPVTNTTLGPEPTMPHPCPKKSYHSFVESRAPSSDTLTWLAKPEFSYDGGEFSFYYGNANSTDKPYITLTAPGYTPTRLDYLALGDSYSSGEGDTIVNPDTHRKHYRQWTDNERDDNSGTLREKCHISTRSYPYGLADVMNLTIDRQWNSVACSGAARNDVSPVRDSYSGQGERLSFLATTRRQNGHQLVLMQKIADIRRTL